MPEGLKNYINNQNEIQKIGEWLSIKISPELETEIREETTHLTNATKKEQIIRILESNGFEIPYEKRVDCYIDYVFETVEKEPKENKNKKILEMLIKDGLLTEEELDEILIIEKQIIEQGEISKDNEKKIESIIKKGDKSTQWIKKMLLFGTMFLGMLLNKDKDQIKKEPIIEEEEKIETKITENPIDSTKTTTMPIKDTENKEKTSPIKIQPKETKNINESSKEKIESSVLKYVDFYTHNEIVKGDFLVLRKSDRTKPTLYKFSEDGKFISKEVVGIGKQEGDEIKGMTTPAGIYMLSKIVKEKDKKIYGENGVLRLLGFSLNGVVDNIGIHIIYPPEKEKRTMAMLNPENSKGISNRCINVFDKYFNDILKSYEKVGEGKLVIIIMEEKDNFDQKKWEVAIQKEKKDAEAFAKM
ncbi:MAG: L,D-transpeptidase [Minisyncoccia bacterium]